MEKQVPVEGDEGLAFNNNKDLAFNNHKDLAFNHLDKDVNDDGDLGVTRTEEERLRRGLTQRHVSMIALAGGCGRFSNSRLHRHWALPVSVG